MILHFVDDEKFIDYVIEYFDRLFPGRNEYVVCMQGRQSALKYIKHSHRVRRLIWGSAECADFVARLFDYEAVVLHYLCHYKARLVAESTSEVNFVWMFWGADAYNNLSQLRRQIFQPKTLELYRSDMAQALRRIASRLFYVVLFFRDSPEVILKKALARVNFCAPVIREDYDFLRDNLPYFKADYAPFSYATIEQQTRGFDSARNLVGKDILLGNSSSYACNHVEAIDLLAKMNLEGRKIVVPLSYGNARYRRRIIAYGRRVLGDAFEPLVDFLPLPDYMAVLNRCGIVIMNHLRQQAVGNIIMALWMGARVYINQQNTVSDFLQRIGAVYSDIGSELCPANPEAFAPLAHEVAENNRRAVYAWYGETAVEQRLMEFVSLITG